MENPVIWNTVVAAGLGGVCGVISHLLIGRGGAGRTVLKTIAIGPLTGATTPDIAHDLGIRGVARLDDESLATVST
jgi:hypothetical protein